MEPEEQHLKDFTISCRGRQEKFHAVTIIKTDDNLTPFQDLPEMNQGDAVGQRLEKFTMMPKGSRPDLGYPCHTHPPKTFTRRGFVIFLPVVICLSEAHKRYIQSHSRAPQ
jgi:hypothetical protein